MSGSFAVLDGRTAAYLDFAGSNAETIAHLPENGRITLMWCAFQGPPNIVRVHGRGEPVYEEDRDLRAKRFAREDDASLDQYFGRKEHIATSIDGLPGLPLPLPATPSAASRP